jgi:hypothetical protein
MNELYWQRDSNTGWLYSPFNDGKDLFEIRKRHKLKGYNLILNYQFISVWPSEKKCQEAANKIYQTILLENNKPDKIQVLTEAVEHALKVAEVTLKDIKADLKYDMPNFKMYELKENADYQACLINIAIFKKALNYEDKNVEE